MMSPKTAVVCLGLSAAMIVGWVSSSRSATISLEDIDSGLTSPTGVYRWLDVANQAYSSEYQANYDYTQATVEVSFSPVDSTLHGTLLATSLKPNFAYQLKLVGTPSTPDNERIGLTGRWWQEEWNGVEWSGGQNLNNKGDGSSPNPNDLLYYQRRDSVDVTSPDSLNYRYTAYLVLDYFVTDGFGDVTHPFEAHSSYHVLFKTTQHPPQPGDGPLINHTFDPDTLVHTAYSTDYGLSTIGVFGEWERLPPGGVMLPEGSYACQMILTEESFHGSGGALAGNWASAMGGNIAFTIATEVTGLGDDSASRISGRLTAFPNPFRSRSEIVYTVPGDGSPSVMLDVFDVRGRWVASLAREPRSAGEHRAFWSGRAEDGSRVPAGVYYLRLVADGKVTAGLRMVLLN